MPNRNNERILDYALERLAANTTYPDFELIVIDDGSDDRSRSILRRWREAGRFAHFKLFERDHRGAVDALNAGLAAATGELVVQLDADASIETPGWLERMVDFFTFDEQIGVLTAKVVFDWGEIHTCGVDLIGPTGFHDRGAVIAEPIGRRTYHQRVHRFRETECQECQVIAEVDGGIGCCMMYRRDVALKLGGYDPGYAPVWFDDLDLTLSIRRHGLKVFFIPDVRVVHHVGKRWRSETLGRRAAHALRWRAAARLPARISHVLNLDHPPGEHWDRLEHHYDFWRAKWGFDMLNPDMDDVLERWGATEVCWNFNPRMRSAGQRIIAAYEARTTA
jgi:glycosyltransferase involved in cell wall biosynthesis